MTGKDTTLPAPSPFRNLLAHVRFGISQEEHEHFFRQMLGEITEPTLPFGLVNVTRMAAELPRQRGCCRRS